jgi:dipeptidyl aminopeptidase/acylaminoacyl peptidase
MTAALAALCVLPAAAQTPPSMQNVLQAVFALHTFSNVTLSPQGDAVAWQEELHPGGLAHPKMQNELFIERIGSAPIRLTAGDGKTFFDEGEPVWSPDGKRIAFLSDAASKDQQQIFIASTDGSGAKQLTHLTGAVQHMQWSPDGKSIAILQIAHPHRKSGATQAGAREVGVIGSEIDEQQIAIVDAASGAVHDITPANAYVYEYCWAPDSKHLAYTYAYGSGDNNWWIARLATIASDGSARRDLLKPAFQINDPQWSPDGRSIALIGGLMSDFGSVGGDVYLVDAHSGKARDIRPGMPLSAASLRWAGSHLLVVAHSKGAEHLYTLSTNGRVHALTSAPEAIGSWSATKNGATVAMVRTSFAHPAEIWAGSPHALHQITHTNSGVPRLYDRARSLQWKDSRYNVQGWLIYPLHYDAHKRYPMITIVHGGPSAESLPSYDSRNVAALTSHGYFVFEPNPRGSFGQGEAFTRANIKDFGYGDWRDDLAGVDAAIKAASIDPQRLGLFGWSYGGYMGMWAETQTRRFKAIVAGAGIVNWQSYYGQNNIDEWMIPFFGKSVYQDPAVYAKSSPITFIEHSHTPVLILQGERDEEVPAPQAFEFYHAMQTLHVPSRLVVYADEGHGPRKPENQIDILNRMVGWFGVYLRQ